MIATFRPVSSDRLNRLVEALTRPTTFHKDFIRKIRTAKESNSGGTKSHCNFSEKSLSHIELVVTYLKGFRQSREDASPIAMQLKGGSLGDQVRHINTSKTDAACAGDFMGG